MWFQGFLARATGKVKLPLTEMRTASGVAILWGVGVGEIRCADLDMLSLRCLLDIQMEMNSKHWK